VCVECRGRPPPSLMRRCDDGRWIKRGTARRQGTIHHVAELLASIPTGTHMKKVEDYRQHASECRSLANRARSQEEREMLLKMAGTWDSLAADRMEHLARQKRVAAFDNGGQSIPVDRLNASNDE
jgi:hypothetical protein